MGHKAEHTLINCGRLITKDLRACLEIATKKPSNHNLGSEGGWWRKVAERQKIQNRAGPMELLKGMVRGTVMGQGAMGRKTRGSEATWIRLGNALSLFYKWFGNMLQSRCFLWPISRITIVSFAVKGYSIFPSFKGKVDLMSPPGI